MRFISGTTFQNNGGGTSPAIDTTGADFIFVGLACAHSQMNAVWGSFSDSKSNIYVTGSPQQVDGSNNADVSGIWVINPTVGSGHTFTFGGGNQLQSMCVAAYKRANSGHDVNSAGGNSAGAFTVQPGSVTPNQNNSLIISVATIVQVGPTLSINQGFTIRENQPLVSGQTYGCMLNDLFQATAAAVNPTITSNMNGNGMGAITFVFKALGEPIGSQLITAQAVKRAAYI